MASVEVSDAEVEALVSATYLMEEFVGRQSEGPRPYPTYDDDVRALRKFIRKCDKALARDASRVTRNAKNT